MGGLLSSTSMTPEEIKENESLQGMDEYDRAAYFIKNAKKVVILSGAGISVTSGIPDFRSPGTGVYDNLQKYDLPFKEAIFTLDFFSYKPQAFYEFAKPFVIEKFYATDCHYFLRILQDKNMLHKIVTQNIDGLEYDAGITKDRVIQAHGGIESAHCLGGHPAVIDEVKAAICSGTVMICDKCKKPCKPDIIFFGESLPSNFKDSYAAISGADLIFVMGTSLQVSPFNSLVSYINQKCPIIVVNKTKLSAIKLNSPRRIMLLGTSDETSTKLCQKLGWEKELGAYIEARNQKKSKK